LSLGATTLEIHAFEGHRNVERVAFDDAIDHFVAWLRDRELGSRCSEGLAMAVDLLNDLPA
jgi:hypothetical protein